MMGFPTYPHICIAGNYNTLAEINLDPKAETATLDLQVDPGRTIAVKPSTPRAGRSPGRRLGRQRPALLDRIPAGIVHDRDPRARPVEPRRVTVTHAGRKLIGSVYLKGDESGPLTIRLQPYGTITGRIVDEDGRPRGGLGLDQRRRLDAGAARRAGHPARRQQSAAASGSATTAASASRASSRASSTAGAPWDGFNVPRRAVPRLDRRTRRSQGPGRLESHPAPRE